MVSAFSDRLGALSVIAGAAWPNAGASNDRPVASITPAKNT